MRPAILNILIFLISVILIIFSINIFCTGPTVISEGWDIFFIIFTALIVLTEIIHLVYIIRSFVYIGENSIGGVMLYRGKKIIDDDLNIWITYMDERYYVYECKFLWMKYIDNGHIYKSDEITEKKENILSIIRDYKNTLEREMSERKIARKRYRNFKSWDGALTVQDERDVKLDKITRKRGGLLI